MVAPHAFLPLPAAPCGASVPTDISNRLLKSSKPAVPWEMDLVMDVKVLSSYDCTIFTIYHPTEHTIPRPPFPRQGGALSAPLTSPIPQCVPANSVPDALRHVTAQFEQRSLNSNRFGFRPSNMEGRLEDDHPGGNRSEIFTLTLTVTGSGAELAAAARAAG